MFSLILLLTQYDYRSRYSGWIGVLGEMLGICLELMIYWYTSKAFAFDAKIGNYFEFIVIGELALLIPSRLIEGALEPIRNLKNSDFIESILLSKFGLGRFMIGSSLSGVMRELIRIVFYFLVLGIFFKVRFSVEGVFEFLLIQIIYFPMFLALAFLFSAVLMFFGRGYNVLNKILMVFVVFSGAYFPQTVLPEFLQGFVSKFIPYSAVVASSRGAITQSIVIEDFYAYCTVFIVASIFCYFGSKLMSQICLGQIRKDKKFVS